MLGKLNYYMAKIWPLYELGHIGTAIKWTNEYLCGVATEKSTKKQQSGEGIKKIKQLHKKLWPKQITDNFPLYFWTFPLYTKKCKFMY